MGVSKHCKIINSNKNDQNQYCRQIERFPKSTIEYRIKTLIDDVISVVANEMGVSASGWGASKNLRSKIPFVLASEVETSKNQPDVAIATAAP